jgi:hypothetical protein
MVSIQESDLRFMIYWTILTMPIVLWFSFKAATFLGNLIVALIDLWRSP